MARRTLVVKNRPLGHHARSVFSLLFGEQYPHDGSICLSATSRTIGRAADLANLLCQKFAPHLLRRERVDIDQVPSFQANSKYNVSTIEIALSPKSFSPDREPKELLSKLLERIERAREEAQEFTICEVEFVLAALLASGCSFRLSCPHWVKVELELSRSEQRRKEKGQGANQIDLGEVWGDPDGNLWASST